MDRFTHRINNLIDYGHKHTGKLSQHQKREVVIAFIERNEFKHLWSEFLTERSYELAENLLAWSYKSISTEDNANATLDLFFDFHVDLIDELFEAQVEERETDTFGFAIGEVLANHRAFKEVSHASR
jgi:hypothetical protein